MANLWLSHVKKTMKTMKSKGTYKKGDGLKKVIMEAKKTYKKHGGEYGGAEGGRRKTRRHSRK
jgi:Tfp pilus assembly protein PilP